MATNGKQTSGGKRLCFWEGSFDGTWTHTGCMSQAAFLRQQVNPDVWGLDPEDLARMKRLRVGADLKLNFGAGGLFRVKRVR